MIIFLESLGQHECSLFSALPSAGKPLLVGLRCGPRWEAFPFSRDGIRNVRQDCGIRRTQEKKNMIQKYDEKE